MLKRTDDEAVRDGDGDDPVNLIWNAIESCDGERALELALRLEADADDYEAALAVAVAHLEADLYPEAEKRLADLARAPLGKEDQHQRLWFLGQTVFSLGRPQEALELFAELDVPEPSDKAEIEWWRGLCHDHLGDTDAADRCFAEAHRLDGRIPKPVSISPDDAERLVAEVVAKLPKKLQATFEELPVVVQDLPSLDLISSSYGAVQHDTLGLYTGVNLLEQGAWDFGTLPPTIFIYRRNLERLVQSEEDLRREIEVTLLHELGHHLGYEEDDLDQLGLA